MSRTRSFELLVLGLGNILCTDDGVGPLAVQRLARTHDVPNGAHLIDGGTLGLALLAYVEEAERLILVDAISADAAPGTLVRVDGDAVAVAVTQRLSPHQVGVADVLHAARWRDRYPTHVVLLGVVPHSVSLGLHLSPAVDASVPALIDSVVREASRLGFVFVPKATAAAVGTDAVGGARLHG